MEHISSRSPASLFFGSAAFSATTSTAMPAPDIVSNSLASSSHRAPDANILSSLDTFHANKRPRLSEPGYPLRYATSPSPSCLSPFQLQHQHQALRNMELQLGLIPRSTPTPLPSPPDSLPMPSIEPFQMRITHNSPGKGKNPPRQPFLHQEVGIDIYRNDRALPDSFQANIEYKNSPLTLPTLPIDRSAKTFQWHQPVCKSEKWDLCHTINALRQLCKDRYAAVCSYVNKNKRNLRISAVDEQLFWDFSQAALPQNSPATVIRLIDTLRNFSRWCHQRNFLPLQILITLGESAIQNALTVFYLDQKLSQQEKDSINNAVSILHRFFTADGDGIDRNTGFFLPADDQSFFDIYQLEKTLTQNQITVLKGFLSWRNQRGLTGLHAWLKEPNEIDNQRVEAFCKDEKLPQEAVKKVISSAVRIICRIFAETQNQVPLAHPVHIEEQSPAGTSRQALAQAEQLQGQTNALSSIFEQLPDLPGGQFTSWPAYQPSFNQRPLEEEEADEAFWHSSRSLFESTALPGESLPEPAQGRH